MTITAGPLTVRETEILTALTDGLTNAEIGQRLGIDPKTVKSHLANMGEKLGTGDRAGMVGVAFRNGWLS